MMEMSENQQKKAEKRKSKRSFPVGYTILLAVILAVQVGLVILGICVEPHAKDVIHQYDVTVQPLEDGSLDITYHLVWEALDPSEPLTWVEIGMPNNHYTVYPESVSSNILMHSKSTSDDYISLKLYFIDSYLKGDVIDFSFRINQKDMLCQNESGYFYQFVPSWFNAIRVENFTFRWIMEDSEDYVQQGSLDYGEYSRMTIQYDKEAFAGCSTVEYVPFDDDGAYNELQDDKIGILVLCCMGAALLIIAEVYIIDCYVSYGRGRGFITSYGAHVHVYGHTNPGYIRARQRYHASVSSGGRSGGRVGGGGCACACACACAGGGRAGCSQKDTYATGRTHSDTEEISHAR